MNDKSVQTDIHAQCTCRDRQTQIHRQTDKQTRSELHTRTGILTGKESPTNTDRQAKSHTHTDRRTDK